MLELAISEVNQDTYKSYTGELKKKKRLNSSYLFCFYKLYCISFWWNQKLKKNWLKVMKIIIFIIFKCDL